MSPMITTENNIPNQGSLADYQSYIMRALTQRGFINQDVNMRLTLLIEEVGELAKAIRKSNNERCDTSSEHYDVQLELADVFFVLVSIANNLSIDLSSAFLKKELINNNRTWVSSH
ncbi:MAG: MazG nucleotide pyrophosphohydrolase domain-containing protein [Cyanobacteriota bacterium]